MEVQHNHFLYVTQWQVCGFLLETSVIGYLFIPMHKGKPIGNTDSVWGSIGGALPPNSGRTHLSSYMNIALGRCADPPELDLPPKGGVVTSKSG
jgi:hypothetical protein